MSRGAIPKVSIGSSRTIGDLTRDLVADLRSRNQSSVEGLTRIRKHLRRLSSGGVGEAVLLAAESLMRENPFAQVHDDLRRKRSVEDEIAEIDRCFRYIREVLEDEGYDFAYDPDAQPDPSPDSDDATPYVDVDEAEEAEAILDQLPPPQRAKPAGKRRRA
jgi:hypothetical protein